LWGTTSKTYINRLQVLQNKCIRITAGWKQKLQLYPLFQKNDMLTVDQIFSFVIAKFMFQFKSKKLPVIFDNYFNLIKDASNYATSAIINNFCLPIYKTRRGQKSIKYLCVKIWNSIAEKMRDLTSPKFKKAY